MKYTTNLMVSALLVITSLIFAQDLAPQHDISDTLELLVSFKTEIDEHAKSKLASYLSCTIKKEYHTINTLLIRFCDVEKYHQAQQYLSSLDNIRYFEENRRFYIPSNKETNDEKKEEEQVRIASNDSYYKIAPLPKWRFVNKIHESQEFGKQKKKTVVAFLTTGVNLPHPSLKGVQWENKKEKNGKPNLDDDGNGWVDDIKGLNLNGTNNNKVGVWSQTIGGAIAGAANYDFERLTDTKGKVKILPIACYKYVKRYGEVVHEYDYYWESETAKIIESLEYASNMGARIVVLPGYVGESELVVEAASKFPGLILTGPQYYYLEIERPSLLAQSNLPNVISVGMQGRFGGYIQSSPAKEDFSALGVIYMIGVYPSERENYFPPALTAGVAANLWSCYPNLNSLEIKDLLKSTVSQSLAFLERNSSGGFLNASRSILGRSSGGAFYNGDWAKIGVSGPTQRGRFGFAIDKKRNLLYLFGGREREHGIVLNDFWKWNGSKWKQLNDGKKVKNYPKDVERIVTFWDARRDVLVLIDQYCNVWTWNKKQWTMREAPRFFKDGGFSLSNALMDEKRDVVVLIGTIEKGQSTDLIHYEYNWKEWYEVENLKDHTNVCFSLIYNPKEEKLIMLGKISEGPFANGLFEFDGEKWKKRASNSFPGISGKMAISNEGRNLLLGSNYDGWVGLSQDIWELEGKNWKPLGFDVPLTLFQIVEDVFNKKILAGYHFLDTEMSLYTYSGSIKPTWIDNMPLNQSDYDGDGKADIALWHPATGEFKFKSGTATKLGKWGDTPVSGDYDGDGKVEHAVVQRTKGKSKWIFENKTIKFGQFDDIPVPLDYDNDGKTDIAVFRKDTATWYFKGKKKVAFGNPADLPVPADYDGDGRPELATYTPLTSTWHIQGMGDFKFGKPGDSPVPADYDGDGHIDIATWNPRKRLWTVMEWGSGKKMIKERFGNKWDIPVPGDYNGDGKAELATYTPMKALWNIKGKPSVKFGSPGDVPLVRGN